MTIVYQKKTALLREVVTVEEAESLLEWLLNNPKAKLNLADCEHLHTANLQVMLAAKVTIAVWPKDSALRSWLETALT